MVPKNLSWAIGFVLFVFFLLVIQFVIVNGYYTPDINDNEGGMVETGQCMLFECGKIGYRSAANVTPPSLEIGFGPGKDDLVFGEIPKGSNAKRFITIAGSEQSRIKVKLMSFGNISTYIRFSADDFILGLGESKDITIEFRSDPEMDEGYYTGGITLIKINPKYDLVDFLLEWI